MKTSFYRNRTVFIALLSFIIVVLIFLSFIVIRSSIQKNHLHYELVSLSIPTCIRDTVSYQNKNFYTVGTWDAAYYCGLTPYGPVLSAIQKGMSEKGFTGTPNNHPEHGALEFRNGSVYLDFNFNPHLDVNGNQLTFTNSSEINGLNIYVHS